MLKVYLSSQSLKLEELNLTQEFQVYYNILLASDLSKYLHLCMTIDWNYLWILLFMNMGFCLVKIMVWTSCHNLPWSSFLSITLCLPNIKPKIEIEKTWEDCQWKSWICEIDCLSYLCFSNNMATWSYRCWCLTWTHIPTVTPVSRPVSLRFCMSLFSSQPEDP